MAPPGIQPFQSVRPAELHSAAEQKKADRMSAWRTGHKPVFRFASTFLEPLEVHRSRPRAVRFTPLTTLATLAILSSRRRDVGKVARYQYRGSVPPAEHLSGRSAVRCMGCGKRQECWCNAQVANLPVAQARKCGPDLPE